MRIERTLFLLLLSVGACGAPAISTGDGGSDGEVDLLPAPADLKFIPPDGMQVRQSVEQLDVTHVTPGNPIVLSDSTGAMVASATADSLGSHVFRKVTPGSGYVVTAPGDHATRGSLTVMSVQSSQPPPDYYEKQPLHVGFGYIVTRDGTPLSIYVTMPGPEAMGPYPTVVDYSGYSPSQPGGPVDGGMFSFLCDQLPVLCDAPNDPAAQMAGLFGYATVSVNIRGTGCSGGAYDFFEELQLLDGYDVIETVAAQPWVLNNKVGMVGISYPGISQLFVAQTQPPHLAAIAPMSVIGNITTTMVPGGILNDGFAQTWISEVLDKAAPYGQGWEQAQVNTGDLLCQENQLLHGQKVDNVAEASDFNNLTHALLDPLDPTLFVHEISVPVFLAGAWQDEQTGPFFVTLLNQFTSAPVVRQMVYNGVHEDGFQPSVVAEWHDFLDLYVARRTPSTTAIFQEVSPLIFQEVFNSPIHLPADRFPPTLSYADARKQYESEPQVTVLFESGAGVATDPGAPMPSFQKQYSAWPPPTTTTERLYFHADGSASATLPTEPKAASQFQLDPAQGQTGILAPGGNVWDKLPAYDWPEPSAGHAIIFETAPLAANQVIVGTASADLWIESTVNDADLQVSVTEVRPDGQEMYVQSGWLRASMRELAADSTALWPDLTVIYADASLLVPMTWTQVRVPLPSFGHVFRAGSKIRVIIDTPGATRAAWLFALKTFPGPGPAVHSVGHDATHPSSIALSLLDGETAPSPLPACPSLRGQPCRAYAAYQNSPSP